MSHMLSLQNMYPFRDIFTIRKKRLIFYSMLNFGDTNSCYRRKCNVSACMSGKKVIARTNNYSKSDSGKGSMFKSTNLTYYWSSREPWSICGLRSEVTGHESLMPRLHAVYMSTL